METKHTKGEWYFRETSSTTFNNVKIANSYTITLKNDAGFYGKSIAVIYPKQNSELDIVRYGQEEALANAARIVECVNNYDALKEENERLKNIAYDLTGKVADLKDIREQENFKHKEENERLRNLLIAYKNMVGNTGYSIAKEEAKYLYEITNNTLNPSTVKEETKSAPINHFVYNGLTFKDDEETLIREWKGWNKSAEGREDEIPVLTFEEWLMMEDNWDAELLEDTTVKEDGNNEQ